MGIEGNPSYSQSWLTGVDLPMGATHSIRLAVMDGEGIGPEVVAAALTVLEAAASRQGLAVQCERAEPVATRDPYGLTLDSAICSFYEKAFAHRIPVLTGPAGGRFVYELRDHFQLYVKLTPIRRMPSLSDASLIRHERLGDFDILVVRDNVAGLYQGSWGRQDAGKTAFQKASYTAEQVDRLLTTAIDLAKARRGKLALISKPNGIPAISALWRERAERLCDASIELELLEVDNACFQIVSDPQRFDVVATPNMIGDVIGDCATLLLGSRGVSYSANFGAEGRAVYQTAHGAAHDLAGTNTANPVAQIKTLSWLLRRSLGLPLVANLIDAATTATLAQGCRTADIAAPDSRVLGTQQLAAAIATTILEMPI